MVDFVKRSKERSGPSLPSHIIPHIYREPPKSIFTRKKERVTEADVTWMTRPDGTDSDPSRINESVSYFAKGVNPSVEVSYQNHGGSATRTNYIHQNQAGSTYKVKVVRPPLYPAEKLLPLSRPRIHQNKSVETNPGMKEPYNTLAYDYDKTETIYPIKTEKAGSPGLVQPTAYYKLEQPIVMTAKWAINENNLNADAISNPNIPFDINNLVIKEETPFGVIVRPTYSVTSNIKIDGNIDDNKTDVSSYIKKEVLFQNIRPNFQVVVYDPSNHVATEVSANIKEKTNIALAASVGKPIELNRENGTKIRLKDYNWTCVQTNAGIDQIILTIDNPDIQLERNTPLYSSSASLSTPSNINDQTNPDIILSSKVQADAHTKFDLSKYKDDVRNENIKLNKSVINNSFNNPANSIPLFKNIINRDTKTKDNYRNKEANNNFFLRLFD